MHADVIFTDKSSSSLEKREILNYRISITGEALINYCKILIEKSICISNFKEKHSCLLFHKVL